MKKYLLTLLMSSMLIFATSISALEIAATRHEGDGGRQILLNQAVTSNTTLKMDPCELYSNGYIKLEFTYWPKSPGNDAANINVVIPGIIIGLNPNPSITFDPSDFNLNRDSRLQVVQINIAPGLAGSCSGIKAPIFLYVDNAKK